MTTKITDANINSSQLENTNFNIGLLGFKMAVNEGLTVFNLVDGVVDEFNDESGTDEAEGSNDIYCATSDYYVNGSPTPISAGFTISSITEPDTSTAGTNSEQGTSTAGEFTVPSGASSLNLYVWGSGGGGSDHQGGVGATCERIGGGGGGYTEGTLAVTPGQTLDIYVGEGGEGPAGSCNPIGSEGGAVGGGCGNYGQGSSGGGGFTGIFAGGASYVEGQSNPAPSLTPSIYVIAGGGGGGGGHTPVTTAFGNYTTYNSAYSFGGAGGGLTGYTGGNEAAQTNNAGNNSVGNYLGGGGSQTQGGQGSPAPSSTPTAGFPGGFLYGGSICNGDQNRAGGGGGFYGGGAGGFAPQPVSGIRAGGGGSSYYGNPQITSGSTSSNFSGYQTGHGAANDPAFANPASTEAGDGVRSGAVVNTAGQDGYVLITGTALTTTSTTIVSTAFSATSVPTTGRIVVFEENVDTPTLNTDIIASITRDGTNYTTATLADSGYVTGSSGQRILTGQVDLTGQPSGQSMRWKLALANNQVKIHGVSLQWS